MPDLWTKDEFAREVRRQLRLILRDCAYFLIMVTLAFACGRLILDHVESTGYQPDPSIVEALLVGVIVLLFLFVFARTERRAKKALHCPSCQKSLLIYQKSVRGSGICPLCQSEVWENALPCYSCGKSMGKHAKQVIESGLCPFCNAKVLTKRGKEIA